MLEVEVEDSTHGGSRIQDRGRLPTLLQRLGLVGGPLGGLSSVNPAKGPTDQLAGRWIPEFTVDDAATGHVNFGVGILEYGNGRAVVPNTLVPAFLPPLLGGRGRCALVHLAATFRAFFDRADVIAAFFAFFFGSDSTIWIVAAGTLFAPASRWASGAVIPSGRTRWSRPSSSVETPYPTFFTSKLTHARGSSLAPVADNA